jgi:hypothetical protein
MRYSIERLSFGGILDQSLRLQRDHFVPMTLGFAILFVPQTFLLESLGLEDPETFTGLADFGIFFGVLLATLVVLPLIQLAVNIVIADAYLSAPVAFGSALQRATRLYVPYLGTSFLLGLFVMLWSMLFLIPGIYFAVCWMLVGAIAVVEDVFGTRALKRSRELVRGNWWRTLGVVLVAGVVSTVLLSALQFVFSYIPVLGSLLSGLAQAVTSTYQAVVLMVLYVDLRCRHEDFDLRFLAEQIAKSPVSQPPPANPGPHAASP